MNKNTTRRKYTAEFKQDTIQLVLKGGQSCSAVERHLGIGQGIVSRWIKEYQQNPKDSFPGNFRRLREITTLFQRKLFFWLNRRSECKSYNMKTFHIMWKQFLEKTPGSLANEGVQINFLSSLL